MSLKKSKISRLGFLKVSGFAAAGLALTACGDSATPTVNSSAATTAPAAATTAAGAATTASGATTTAAGTTAAVTTAAATTAAAPKGSPTPELAKAGQGGTNLTYVVWGGTAGPAKEYATITSVYPDMAKQYSLSLISAGTGDGEVANSLRLALAAGKNIPDIVALNRIQLAEFVEAGEVADLTEAFAPVKDDLYAGALNLVTYNGKVMAFPRELKSKLFYYRGDMFDKAGIKLDDLNTTAGFIEAGKKFHAAFPKSYIINLGPKPAGYYPGMFLSAYPNTSMADSSGKYQLTSNKAFADSFKFLKDILDAKISLPIDDFSNDWKQSFDQEAIGGALGANWLRFFLPGYAPKQTGLWKVTNWPKFGLLADQSFGSEAGGSIWIVPKRAPHAKEAITYLSKLALDRQGSVALYKNGGFTPLIKSAQPDVLDYVKNAKKPEAMKDAAWAAQPQNFFGKDFPEIEFNSYATVKVFPYDPSASKEFDILNQGLQKYMGGDTPLDQTLAKAQSDMEGQIGNPYQK